MPPNFYPGPERYVIIGSCAQYAFQLRRLPQAGCNCRHPKTRPAATPNGDSFGTPRQCLRSSALSGTKVISTSFAQAGVAFRACVSTCRLLAALQGGDNNVGAERMCFAHDYSPHVVRLCHTYLEGSIGGAMVIPERCFDSSRLSSKSVLASLPNLPDVEGAMPYSTYLGTRTFCR